MAQSRAELTDFVAARRRHVRRIAFAVTGDWHLAEDITQTALTKLYVAWPRVCGSADAYARTIIVRSVVDESRRPWRREVPVAVSPGSVDVAAASVADAPDGLITALQMLSPMQRSAVVLRHWLDLSVEETAREQTQAADPAPNAPSVSAVEDTAGWRTESYRNVTLQVPDSWGYGALDQWCVGADGGPGTPVVQLPFGAQTQVGCSFPSIGYGLQFS